MVVLDEEWIKENFSRFDSRGNVVFTGFEFEVPTPPAGYEWAPGDVQGNYILIEIDGMDPGYETKLVASAVAVEAEEEIFLRPCVDEAMAELGWLDGATAENGAGALEHADAINAEPPDNAIQNEIDWAEALEKDNGALEDSDEINAKPPANATDNDQITVVTEMPTFDKKEIDYLATDGIKPHGTDTEGLTVGTDGRRRSLPNHEWARQQWTRLTRKITGVKAPTRRGGMWKRYERRGIWRNTRTWTQLQGATAHVRFEQKRGERSTPNP